MPSIIQKKECSMHQWMSFATDGSCIKCVSCGEIRMLDDQNNTIIMKKDEK